MKKSILLILLIISAYVKAQDYQLSFTGSGESTYVDSVFVENLTQGTSLELSGYDVLHLVGTTGINNQLLNNQVKVNIYPNPIFEVSNLEIVNQEPDNIRIEIYNSNGIPIVSYRDKLLNGINVFEISGFSAGVYTVNIKTSSWQKSLNFVSINAADKIPDISAGNNVNVDQYNKPLIKNTKSIKQMQYNDGDNLLLKGVSGDLARVLTIVPNQSQTINFQFVPCTDLDGNHYAVVSINNQIWMAENLRYLPNVVGPVNGSPSEPYYYVYGYNGTNVEDAQATANYNIYGVLYNWQAAMSACPSGWHLPSYDDWLELVNYLGYSIAGGKLKETSTSHWNSPNYGATNRYGFTALPGGIRASIGSFGVINTDGAWWTAEELQGSVWYFNITYNLIDIDGGYHDKEMGFSVRCVMD